MLRNKAAAGLADLDMVRPQYSSCQELAAPPLISPDIPKLAQCSAGTCAAVHAQHTTTHMLHVNDSAFLAKLVHCMVCAPAGVGSWGSSGVVVVVAGAGSGGVAGTGAVAGVAATAVVSVVAGVVAGAGEVGAGGVAASPCGNCITDAVPVFVAALAGVRVKFWPLA